MERARGRLAATLGAGSRFGDASAMRSLVALMGALPPIAPEARMAGAMASEPLAACDADGRLPAHRAREGAMLVDRIERRLA